MSVIRKAVVVFDEFSSMTLFKPFSDEYRNQLFVVHEDAYGEAILEIKSIADMKIRLNVSDEEFNEILKDLGL